MTAPHIQIFGHTITEAQANAMLEAVMEFHSKRMNLCMPEDGYRERLAEVLSLMRASPPAKVELNQPEHTVRQY